MRYLSPTHLGSKSINKHLQTGNFICLSLGLGSQLGIPLLALLKELVEGTGKLVELLSTDLRWKGLAGC